MILIVNIYLVGPRGFEPLTNDFEDRYSIQLSQGPKVGRDFCVRNSPQNPVYTAHPTFRAQRTLILNLGGGGSANYIVGAEPLP
jgi:hypothetical protein